MAFQAPNAGQERQNRKLLEQLEEQKKRLRLQTTTASTPSTTSTATTSPAQSPSQPVTVMGGPETQHMTPAQRAALQHAHANSVGYFITQDSSFGNLILPVLPRI